MKHKWANVFGICTQICITYHASNTIKLSYTNIFFQVLVICKIVMCTSKLRKCWKLYFEELGYVVHTLTVYNDIQEKNSNASRIMITERPMIQVVVISHYLSVQKFSATFYQNLITLV